MVTLSQCTGCKHGWNAARRATREIYPRCAAFPDGIPDEILWNELRHTKPYPGDRGIQYDPIDEEVETEAAH